MQDCRRRQPELRSAAAWYIIDPTGVTWDFAQLAQQQEASPVSIFASAQTMLDALVMSKGYAGLRITDVACHVFVNPCKVRPATVAALRLAVGSQPSQLIILGCYREQWNFKVHVSKNDVLNHILALVGEDHSPVTGLMSDFSA